MPTPCSSAWAPTTRCCRRFGSARPGSTVGFVGVPHGVELPVARCSSTTSASPAGWPRSAQYLPELLELVTSGTIDPGLVFDSSCRSADVAEGYRAMDERRAIKVYLDV